MRKLLFFLLIVLYYNTAHSQLKGSVSGVITNKETDEPLQGVTITVKDDGSSTISNQNGSFSLLNISTGQKILLISHVGFQTVELPIEVIAGENIAADVTLISLHHMGDEVVVSASKRLEKITDAPASIHVIGQKQLQQFSGSNVGELAAYVQGVEFVRMGVDNVSFNARGLNNAFNGKVFQMVDGRNSMQPLSGNLMMGNNMSVNKEDIDRIEILLGPQTALYGPNVHNALFNFITKDPRIYQGTTLSVSAGNQSQFSARIRQGEKINNRWAYKLTGEYAVGKDFDFRDSIRGVGGGPNQVFGPIDTIAERIDLDFRRLRGEANLYYNVTPRGTIIVSTGGSKSNTINTTTAGHNQFVDLTNYFVQARFTSPRFYATVYNAWANFGKSYNVGNYTRDFHNRTHSRLFDKNHPDYPTQGHLSAEEADIFARRNLFKETPQRLNAEVQYNYTFQKPQLFLVAGLTYQEDKPRGYGINLVDSFRRLYVTQFGAVLQLEKSLPWEVRFIGAARLDRHSNFGNFLSPKIALVKRVGAGNFRVTWGQANSMPSILYQYASTGGSFFGNGEGITYIPNGANVNDKSTYKITTPLLPEMVSTWEVGYKGTFFNKMNVDVSYYNGVSNNFFTPSISVLGRAIYVGKYGVTHNPLFAGQVDSNGILRNARFSTIFNFGDVKVYGIDAGINYQFNKIINLAVNYSWLGSNISDGSPENDANDDGWVTDDEKSVNSPRNRFTASLSFDNLLKQKAFIKIAARYVEKYDFYSGNQISTGVGEGKWGFLPLPNGGGYPKNFDWGPLGGTTVDIRGGYRLNELVSFTLGITNLFDAKVREFAGSPYIRRLYQAEVKISVPNK